MVSTRALALKAAASPVRGGAAPPEATTMTPPPSLSARLGGVDADGSGGTQEYERRRDERIRENMERMQRLGIVDLALKFRSSISGGSSAARRAYNKRDTPSPDLPPRRSSRLQNVTPVSYSEIRVASKDEVTEKKMGNESPIEEVYTDEHEKLLGTCEISWTLFVDGYSKDGVRIYDPVKGKTCHQCRQKTLGHRTNCSKCNIVQGQFCGDCLYMRYGENVLEANKNPNWICPVCRGICNCSLCRTKKGWVPTGILYKKISRLGFKSVAHFLIQTKRAQTNTEGPVASHPISAKRSLPFTDEVGPLQISDDHCNQQMILFDGNKDKDTERSRDSSAQKFDESGKVVSTLETSKTSRKRQKKETESTLVVRLSTDSVAGRLKSHNALLKHSANNSHNDNSDRKIILSDLDNSSQLCYNEGKDAVGIGNEEVQHSNKCDGISTLERAGKTGQKHKAKLQYSLSVKPSPDSIAGRLRSRGVGYKGSECNGEKETQRPDEYISRVSTLEASIMSSKKQKIETVSTLVVRPSTDSIAGRLINRKALIRHSVDNSHIDNSERQVISIDLGNNSQLCCVEGKDAQCIDNEEVQNLDKCDDSPTLEIVGKMGKKHKVKMQSTLSVKPSPDSIAGRLRSSGIGYKVSESNGEKETQRPDEYINGTTLENCEKVGKSSKEKDLNLVTVQSLGCITGSINEDGGCKSIKNIIRSNTKLGNKHNNEKKLVLLVHPSIDCIARRLRSHSSSFDGRDFSIDKGTQNMIMSNNAIALKSNGKPRNRKELALIVIPTSDSIAGRLRSHNKKGGNNAWFECEIKHGLHSGTTKEQKLIPTV